MGDTPSTGPIPYVDLILAGLAQVNIGIPIAFEATRAILTLLRDAGANVPTDAEAIAQLRALALREKQAHEEWLESHGYD